MLAGNGAIEEPQSLSAGGNLIYRSICCDRVGDLFSVYPPLRNQSAWSYNLEDLAPGYDDMWALLDGLPNLNGWYRGKSESINGIYHNHGVQNPIIPYKDRLFIHRSNAVIAFGPGTGPGKLPLVAIQSAEPNQSIITQEALKTRLETEVRKIVDTGHLRPGYYTMGQFSVYKEFADYFDNPGDTLYTLAIAYPHLSESVQEQVRVYLRNVFMDYFDPAMYATIGWADGAPREAMPLPPEIENNLSSLEPRIRPMRASWGYPQHNYYGMWKYAGIFPQDAARVYELAKSTIQVPVPDVATTEYFIERPYEMNGYIAGYIGFLNLQTLAGKADEDAQLRVSVSNELDRLLQLRALNLSKNTSWLPDKYTKKHLDVARNFILLVPELGDYLYQHAFDSFNQTIQEYNYVAPYWFVSRYESAIGEGTTSALYNYSAIFQAKAFIQKESKAELSKYLDVPAFERGDLLYIQNLVAVIEAP